MNNIPDPFADEMTLAHVLHRNFCSIPHIPTGCAWNYEQHHMYTDSWDDWNGIAHRHWVAAAHRILEETDLESALAEISRTTDEPLRYDPLANTITFADLKERK